jgi:hypothetical protein
MKILNPASGIGKRTSADTTSENFQLFLEVRMKNVLNN